MSEKNKKVTKTKTEEKKAIELIKPETVKAAKAELSQHAETVYAENKDKLYANINDLVINNLKNGINSLTFTEIESRVQEMSKEAKLAGIVVSNVARKLHDDLLTIGYEYNSDTSSIVL
jgi:hypothetical protein